MSRSRAAVGMARTPVTRSSFRSRDPVGGLARQVGEPAYQSSQRRRKALLPEIVHVVECLVGVADIDLVGNHQRAATEFEDLPQRHQRTETAGRGGGGPPAG